MFKNKTLLITGGTGSFGNAVLRRFLKTDIAQIRIFSRDEKKQDDMRHDYSDPKLKFYIGDVRQLDSVQEAMPGVDFVFHAAALKQVPSCEIYPMEAIRTNALGARRRYTRLGCSSLHWSAEPRLGSLPELNPNWPRQCSAFHSGSRARFAAFRAPCNLSPRSALGLGSSFEGASHGFCRARNNAAGARTFLSAETFNG
jgi:hypothetical protein